MFDDQIRQDLHELAGDAPTGGDIDAVLAVGFRQRRYRRAGILATMALIVIGLGLAVPQLLDRSQSLVNTDIADDGNDVVDGDAARGDEDDEGPPAATDEDGQEEAASDRPTNADDADLITTDPNPQPIETADDEAGSEDPQVSPLSESSPGDVDFTCWRYGNGSLSWVDHGQDVYRIYRSIDGGSTYTWLGRTYGDLTFSDPDFQAGYLYRVNYEGLRQAPCEPTTDFGCQINSVGTIAWTDEDQDSYQLYRSTNEGGSRTLLSQVNGTAAFTDPDYESSYRYEVGYDGLPSPVTCVSASAFVCQVVGAGRLVWADAGQETYFVARSTDGGASYDWIDTVVGETFFAVADHQPGHRYRVNHKGQLPVPCRETDAFTCQVNSLGVVSWNDDGSVAATIYRSSGTGGSYTAIEKVNGTSIFVDVGYRPGQTYRIGRDGFQDPYPCRSDPTFVCRMNGVGRIFWTDGGQARYRIYRSASDSGPFTWLAGVDGQTSFVDPDPGPGNEYQYAVNYDGSDGRVTCYP